MKPNVLDGMAPEEVLGCVTPAGWLEAALANVPAVLQDHAHCEKKAAATAMAMVSAYPQDTELVQAMVRLAQEELRHFQLVLGWLQDRGVTLQPDAGDPYAVALLKLRRRGNPIERKIDWLLVASLIEARSWERLLLLSENLEEPALREAYARLARAEAGHYKLFVRLAGREISEADLETRMAELVAEEAKIIGSQAFEARVH